MFQIENEGKPESVLTSLFETLTGFVWLTYFLTNLAVPLKRKKVIKVLISFTGDLGKELKNLITMMDFEEAEEQRQLKNGTVKKSLFKKD